MLPSMPSSLHPTPPSTSLSLQLQAMHSDEDHEELYGLPPPNPTQPFYTLSHAHKNNPSTSNLPLNMKSTEIFTIHTTLPPPNLAQDSMHFNTFYKNTSFPDYYHAHPLTHEPSSNTSSYSNNLNSMVATVGKEGVAGELRRKRLVSNRESARRTRLRRKKQIEELQSQKNELIATTQKLTEQLINLSQCINQLFQENSQLKEDINLLQSVNGNGIF